MGFSKEERPGYEEKLNQAISLCCEAGAIFSCPDHPEVHINLQEFSSISELVSQILENDLEAVKEFHDEDELARYIQNALDVAELECKKCAEIYSAG